MYIGVDVGGTNLVAGLVDDNFNVVTKAKTRANPNRPPEEIVADIVRIAHEAAELGGVNPKDLIHVGIGTPGKIDNGSGEILFANNLPFRNLPIRQMINQVWDIPVFVENDANCAVLGEYYAGAAKFRRYVIVLTIGTGLGGGIMLSGKLYRGVSKGSTEPGHSVIIQDGEPCTCGRRGCWESYAAVRGLKRETRIQMEAHPESVMWAMTEGSVDKISGTTPFRAAKAGDIAGRKAVDNYIRYLATGLLNMINTYCPEIVCIGGGVSNEEDALLIDPLRELVKRDCYGGPESCPEIVKAALGNDAGIVGAAIAGLIEENGGTL